VSSTTTIQWALEDTSLFTNLVRRMRCGVLGNWAGCVWRHILEDPAQPLDNIVIVDLATRPPRRVVVARILVPEGIACHQRLYPPLHEA
jgi:hypothetical protein